MFEGERKFSTNDAKSLPGHPHVNLREGVLE
jgi:hypothetical protein